MPSKNLKYTFIPAVSLKRSGKRETARSGLKPKDKIVLCSVPGPTMGAQYGQGLSTVSPSGADFGYIFSPRRGLVAGKVSA